MVNPVLRRLVLHRFRSFEKEAIEFDNPTFLVGQNGSGKSNLADAFAFLADVMTLPLQAILEQRGGLASVGHLSSVEGAQPGLGLAVELENPDKDISWARYAFRLYGFRGHRFEVGHERCVVQRSNGSRDWFERFKPAPPSCPLIGWESTVDSLKPAVEPNALALPLIGGDRRFQAVFRFLSDMRVYRIEPTALRGMQDPEGGGRLRSDGSNAASVLREIQRESPDNWEQIRELLEIVVPGTVDIQPKEHGNKLTLEFTQSWENESVRNRRQPKSVRFEAFNMSDGTLRVLGLLTAIFQRPAPSLLVIEEPEATIHPGALGVVLDVLRHAGRFMQVVVTTHSHDVLDVKWIEDHHLRIASWAEGTTRIRPISSASRAALSEHLMGAGELLWSNALTPDDQFTWHPRQYELFPEDDLS